jgi:RimJ/RimL family protein N-acetyltransferase
MGHHARMDAADGAPRLRTERLLLREWRPADRVPFAALNADPEVARFLVTPLDRAESDALIERIEERWREDGFGQFAVERVADGVFIGFIGIAKLPWAPDPVPEIGWRLAREAWGQGYATEGAREAMRFAFADLLVPELVSYTTAANQPSRRVMTKLGMERLNPAAPYDFLHPRLPEGHPIRPHVTYRRTREDWLAARAVG